jgi:hypothetical protein
MVILSEICMRFSYKHLMANAYFYSVLPYDHETDFVIINLNAL